MKINDLIQYCSNKLNVSISNYYNKETSILNTYLYAHDILYAVQALNKPALHLREERRKTREDLEDLERCNVAADSISDNESGFNNGFKENTVYLRQIEKLKLKEQLTYLLAESLLHEKHVKETNDIIIELIDMLPQETFKETLKLSFIDCMSTTTIAIELQYQYDTILHYKKRGIKAIGKLIDNLLKTQKNTNL